MKKILLVFGTRPEAIKMCPLVRELKSRENLKTKVCVTGQHREMLDSVLGIFGVKKDYDLAVMEKSQPLDSLTNKILSGITEVLKREKPDTVLVHGDTTTAFAAAVASFYMKIPIGHVEAGLRTYEILSPFPEEFNRRTVSLIASYHFAPTELAKENLLREGVFEKSIFVTGNTGIDALRTTVSESYSSEELELARTFRLVLLTAHRRESMGEPMRKMLRAIRRVASEREDVRVLYPAHMNPNVRKIAQEELSGCERIRITDPLDVVDFHNVMARSYMILTDSGGIQEEAPYFGKPVLVMRDSTERPEGIATGTLRLVGTSEESVYRGFSELLDSADEYRKMSLAKNPYGDGFASRRIVDILANNI